MLPFHIAASVILFRYIHNGFIKFGNRLPDFTNSLKTLHSTGQYTLLNETLSI